MPNESRSNLERLPSEVLFNLARNEAAVERKLAIEILVERGSEFATKPEIAIEAEKFIIDHPRVLVKIDPAGTLMAAHKLPGLVDVVAAEQERRRALATTVAGHHDAHTQNHTALSLTVANHKEANDLALASATTRLWKSAAAMIYNLKLEHDAQIAALRADHDAQIADAKARLTLLERSPWKKLTHWVKVQWARLRKPKVVPVVTEQEDDAMFTERVTEMVRRA